MDQTPLFTEDVFEALRDVVRVLGGPRAVGHRLWPEKGVEAAARLLHDCLNPGRPEKLDPAQLVFLCRLGREAGCHVLMHHLADAAGYERPRPFEPKDELQALVDQATQLTRAQQQVAARLERLLGASALRSVA